MMTISDQPPFPPEGCVNGRFQPPHLGHFEYILEAKRRCAFLWIGITRYDHFDDTPCDIATHRASAASNPLTYYERVKILTTVLDSEHVPRESYAFIPFPIDRPSRIPQFLPVNVPVFTTIYDDWNRHKVKVLEEAGYRVIVLWERSEKKFSGHLVRDAIKANTSAWEVMIPAAAVDLVKRLDLMGRLRT